MQVPWLAVAPLIVARSDLALTFPRAVGALREVIAEVAASPGAAGRRRR